MPFFVMYFHVMNTAIRQRQQEGTGLRLLAGMDAIMAGFADAGVWCCAETLRHGPIDAANALIGTQYADQIRYAIECLLPFLSGFLLEEIRGRMHQVCGAAAGIYQAKKLRDVASLFYSAFVNRSHEYIRSELSVSDIISRYLASTLLQTSVFLPKSLQVSR